MELVGLLKSLRHAFFVYFAIRWMPARMPVPGHDGTPNYERVGTLNSLKADAANQFLVVIPKILKHKHTHRLIENKINS